MKTRAVVTFAVLEGLVDGVVGSRPLGLLLVLFALFAALPGGMVVSCAFALEEKGSLCPLSRHCVGVWGWLQYYVLAAEPLGSLKPCSVLPAGSDQQCVRRTSLEVCDHSVEGVYWGYS